MSYPVPVLGSASSADFVAVTAASTQFSVSMAAGQFWVFQSSTACYINQGANPTAAAAQNSMFVSPGQSVLIDGSLGAKLAVVQSATSGSATLTRAKLVK